MNDIEALRPQFDRIQSRAFYVGVGGLTLLMIGAFISTHEFFRSYLYGYVFWAGLTLGCLGILLLHHLVSGHWGNVIQRMVESGSRMMLPMAVLFIPILIGLHDLYPWADHSYVEASHTVHKKAGYLNIPFFIVRAVLYFGLWTVAAFLLSNWSLLQDRTADPTITRKMRIFSGPALAGFVLTVSFASVDWLMSLEPEWYSSIYGMLIIVGAVLTTLAFCIVLLFLLGNREPLSEVLTTRHYHHLGNLLMAFTILWAYMAFSQFLIIWSGNLPEDNFWYIRRIGTGWNIVAVVLLIGHFFVPFLLLLSRKSKRVIGNLALIAGGLLVMRLVDLFWLIMPAFTQGEVRFHWLDIVAPVGIGGIWISLFIQQLKNNPLLPLHDPRFEGTAEMH